jgi:hypothetical protein
MKDWIYRGEVCETEKDVRDKINHRQTSLETGLTTTMRRCNKNDTHTPLSSRRVARVFVLCLRLLSRLAI